MEKFFHGSVLALEYYQVQQRKKYYTNEELYTKLQPDKEDMPYVYADFEWQHCRVSDSLSTKLNNEFPTSRCCRVYLPGKPGEHVPVSTKELFTGNSPCGGVLW